MESKAVESKMAQQIEWEKCGGLVPTIAQDVESGAVLMMAYSSAESLRLSLESGIAHYFSRSKNRIWKKGESSGNTQEIVEIRTDCDNDTLLFIIRQNGAACHTGEKSCFFNVLQGSVGATTHNGESVIASNEATIQNGGESVIASEWRSHERGNPLTESVKDSSASPSFNAIDCHATHPADAPLAMTDSDGFVNGLPRRDCVTARNDDSKTSHTSCAQSVPRRHCERTQSAWQSTIKNPSSASPSFNAIDCHATHPADAPLAMTAVGDSAHNTAPKYPFFDNLYHTILSRKNADPKKSYVASLFQKGENTICKKIVEEAGELTFALKDADKGQIVYECADLVFHALVGLAKHNIHPEQVESELKRREGLSGIDEKNSRVDSNATKNPNANQNTDSNKDSNATNNPKMDSNTAKNPNTDSNTNPTKSR